MLALPKTPFPVTFRELWLPPAINGLLLPSSVEGGHPLTLTGARLGSTADGVHFDGSVTSNINYGAIHDNAATFWLKFRFKFDQTYVAGSGDQYIWGKFLDATHFVWLVFKTADGKLYFEGDDALGNNFSIAAQDGAADITTWEAGRWYTVLASISAANDVRFIIDNGTVVTVVTPIAFPNGGDFIIGDYNDPGAGTGFEGIIADFVGSTIDNTVAEETDLYKGIPPADAVNFWPLREGRGITAYDRGTGGNNGTLDTSCKWKFGQVEQPVLDVDGINDQALSPLATILTGDITYVLCLKWFQAPVGRRGFGELSVDATNRLTVSYTATIARVNCVWGGANVILNVNLPLVIGDYCILVLSVVKGGLIKEYVNGAHAGTADISGLPGDIAGLGRMRLGYDAFDHIKYCVMSVLFAALIDGAFTAKQARAFSRWLKDIYNLPILV